MYEDAMSVKQTSTVTTFDCGCSDHGGCQQDECIEYGALGYGFDYEIVDIDIHQNNKETSMEEDDVVRRLNKGRGRDTWKRQQGSIVLCFVAFLYGSLNVTLRGIFAMPTPQRQPH